MAHLVATSSSPHHLWKKTGHLVRTPITVKLQPVERAYYAVAGSYTSANWPDGGFIDVSTLQNVIAVGATCTRAAMSPSSSLQIWRQVASGNSHDPETVWYQGGYATSAPNLNAAMQSCEAFTQFGAYRFEFPSGLRRLTAKKARVTFQNGGCIQCFQSAGARSASNRLLKGFTSDWNTAPCQFVTTQNLLPLMALLQQPKDTVDLMEVTGTPRNIRDLWAFTGTTRDGAIPTFNENPTQTYYLGSQTLSHFSSNKGCWIVPCFQFIYSSATSYRPQYFNSTAGWWASLSCWGLTMDVEFE